VYKLYFAGVCLAKLYIFYIHVKTSNPLEEGLLWMRVQEATLFCHERAF